ncbi:hypothetical protein EG329_011274 [Mollisiaceae sp. DMI_Dod_QoI]|nr:hypothetical protein EG329_011274 [Helotiales sp. DMI_Dod_QoI]
MVEKSASENNGTAVAIRATPLAGGDIQVAEPLSRLSSEPPYTIFSSKEKLVLIILGSMAAFLSPVTANIYYPAIADLSHDFGVSTNLINLTITVFLLFQGLAPTFIGSISDAIGRRPAYLICFTIYVAANLGLALQDNYAGLMVLRCLQRLLFGGFYTLVAALPTDFTHNFGFNSLQVGLCYIPFGFGSMTAAVATGKTVDWNFRRIAKQLDYPITRGRQSDLSNFPIEQARIQVVVPLICLGSITIIAYGWVLHATDSLAGPLVLLYFLGFSISGAFSALSTLMIDLYPKAPGTATAAANWVRCWMGAGAVAAIGPLLNEIGTGWDKATEIKDLESGDVVMPSAKPIEKKDPELNE